MTERIEHTVAPEDHPDVFVVRTARGTWLGEVYQPVDKPTDQWVAAYIVHSTHDGWEQVEHSELFATQRAAVDAVIDNQEVVPT